MKIEMGKKYQTKDGNPVRILCVDREHSDYCVVGLRATKTCGEQMSSWTVEGHFRKGEDNEDDLVEVVEPVTIEWWANAYPDGSSSIHKSKVIADAMAHGARIACVKLTGTYKPGDGLDKEAVR